VGNTAMKNMNYSAPQDKEPASCGLIKCKECDKEMHPYFYTGMYHNPHKRTFCSRKCQSKNNAREYIKNHPATEETKRAKSEYDARYRKENHDRRIEQCRKWYALNKKRDDVIKRQREYTVKYRERHKTISRNYEKRHWDKILEIRAIRKQFGTAIVPVEVKQKWAMVHVGNRLTRQGCAGRRPFDTSEDNMKRIFNQIKKGETHAAYL
jgi:hypothetical protein